MRDRRIYVDSRLHKMYNIAFTEPFFKRGAFPAVVQNGSASVVLENPWVNGTLAAPFDQGECATPTCLCRADSSWCLCLVGRVLLDTRCGGGRDERVVPGQGRGQAVAGRVCECVAASCLCVIHIDSGGQTRWATLRGRRQSGTRRGRRMWRHARWLCESLSFLCACQWLLMLCGRDSVKIWKLC